MIIEAISKVLFKLLFRVSLNEKGMRYKLFIYYITEDFIAIDIGQIRGYREELRKRWVVSLRFGD
jgi:hypothetical protein